MFDIVGPLMMNQYLIGCARTGQAVLIDAGDAKAASGAAKSFGFDIQHILLTHAHSENIAALADLREIHRNIAPIHLHPADLPNYEAAGTQSKVDGMLGSVRQPPPVDMELCDGQMIAVGQFELMVIHTPGHTTGHVCFYCEEHGFLIGGDLLFSGSVGRTDLPGGNATHMQQSLRKIMRLPDHTRVFAGHMNPTTIVVERRKNPHVSYALGDASCT